MTAKMPMSGSFLVAFKIAVAMTETPVRILYVIRDSHTGRACRAFYSGGKRFVKPYLLFSTSPVRHCEKHQRVKGILVRAIDAEFDVPGKPRRSHARIEYCHREVSERR